MNLTEAESITKDLQAQGYNVSQAQIEELLKQGYSRDEIIRLITLLGLTYGKNNVGAYIAQYIGYGHQYAMEVARIMSKLKFPGLNADTVYELVSTDMGENTYLTEAQALRILTDLTSIYKYDKTNGANAISNAVQALLRQNLDTQTTVALADSFAEYFRRMQDKSNRFGNFYQPLPQALQNITYAINNLNFNNLRARTFRTIKSHNKHIFEMGFKNEQEYMQAAIAFMSGQPNADVLQGTRPDGTIVRWNMDNGDFGIIDPRTGNVVTYYDLGTGQDGMVKFLRELSKTQGE